RCRHHVLLKKSVCSIRCEPWPAGEHYPPAREYQLRPFQGLDLRLERVESGDDVVVLGLSTETRVALDTLSALRSLSRTSRLNAIQFSRSNRRTTSRTIRPLIRLKSHQLPPG